MDDLISKFSKLENELIYTKNFFFEILNQINSSIHIFTHLDADGLSAGAILGKALYRERIGFQISILKQLEKEEILKIRELVQEGIFPIFCDFGSGQYLELIEQFNIKNHLKPFIIIDHHIPQNITDKSENQIYEIYKKTSPWHVNPYFYDIDGSVEISGSGLCYIFAKILNEKNKDLSSIALVGATGDIQNKGAKKSFIGINKIILEDAINMNHLQEVTDLNFSPIKPLNEAIAYSSDFNIPGLTGDPNKTLIFLQRLGIIVENTNGNVRSLNELNQNEKQKVTSAIIRYISVKLNLNPNDIINKLIINRYVFKNDIKAPELNDLNEFSNLLNSCGRTDNGSIGIAVAMGDRKEAFQEAQKNLNIYKKSILKALSWIHDKNKIQQKEFIQYFFGEDIISDRIVGTICSMLIFEESTVLESSKPIFGFAKINEKDLYKVSARANQKLLEKGLNLSEVLRSALKLTNIDTLGGGHPLAAGTKIPFNKVDEFLENCNTIVKKQLGF
ncbi:MAG: DHHA1 domain-containing protein [Promethearchaeota archaeon]